MEDGEDLDEDDEEEGDVDEGVEGYRIYAHGRGWGRMLMCTLIRSHFSPDCSPIAPPPKHREDFADKIESKLLTLHAVNGRDTHVAWGRKRENAREEERG